MFKCLRCKSKFRKIDHGSMFIDDLECRFEDWECLNHFNSDSIQIDKESKRCIKYNFRINNTHLCGDYFYNKTYIKFPIFFPLEVNYIPFEINSSSEDILKIYNRLINLKNFLTSDVNNNGLK